MYVRDRSHYRGTYHCMSKRVRQAAYADPTTRCRRCGNTYAKAVQLWGVKAAAWQAGHVIDGHRRSALAPEHARCNMVAGAKLGNARRRWKNGERDSPNA